MFKNARMLTACLCMCSTGVAMSRGGGGDITGTSLGARSSLHPSQLLNPHTGCLWGLDGAPSGCRRRSSPEFCVSLPERPELASPQSMQSRHSAPSTECRDYTGVLTERRPRSRSVTQTPPTPSTLWSAPGGFPEFWRMTFLILRPFDGSFAFSIGHAGLHDRACALR